MLKHVRTINGKSGSIPVYINWIGGIPEHLLDPDRDRRPDSPEAVARRKKRRERSRQRVVFETIIIPSLGHIKDEARSAAPNADSGDNPDAPTSESRSHPAAE